MNLLMIFLILLNLNAQPLSTDVVEEFYQKSLTYGTVVPAISTDYAFLTHARRYSCEHYKKQFDKMREVQGIKLSQVRVFSNDENSSTHESVETLYQEWKATDLFKQEQPLAEVQFNWELDFLKNTSFEMNKSFKMFHFDRYKGSAHDEYLLLLDSEFNQVDSNFNFKTQIGYDELCLNDKFIIILNPNCKVKHVLDIQQCKPEESIILKGNLSKIRAHLFHVKKGRNRIDDVLGGGK